MKFSIDCLPCLFNQAVKFTKERVDSRTEQKRLLQQIMLELAKAEDGASAPYVAHKIQRIFKQYLQDPDPFYKEKQYYNSEMLKLEHCLCELIASADDPLNTALKLAAAGNVIDFGPGYELSREKVLTVIHQTLDQNISPGVFEALKSRLGSSRRLLYLGDNCGEIVFDKVFIRTIREYFPHLSVQFAARGGPVLNDVTKEDAYMVGMEEYAEVIDNGTDIQGTELAYCPQYFLDAFLASDVIIAKGQGNFESLYGQRRDNIYYIFLCKCSLFMQRCGARQNDIVLMADGGLT